MKGGTDQVVTLSDEYLKAHLQALAGFASSRQRPEGFKYGSYEELVLEEGEAFTVARLQTNGPLKECYSNSLHLALQEGWSYCEGYALGTVIPVLHAWCLDDDEVVVETTWETVGTEYYGIALNVDWAAAEMVKAGYYGLLDNDFMNRNSILKKGFQ